MKGAPAYSVSFILSVCRLMQVADRFGIPSRVSQTRFAIRNGRSQASSIEQIETEIQNSLNIRANGRWFANI